jgi:hypothetical protein
MPIHSPTNAQAVQPNWEIRARPGVGRYSVSLNRDPRQRLVGIPAPALRQGKPREIVPSYLSKWVVSGRNAGRTLCPPRDAWLPQLQASQGALQPVEVATYSAVIHYCSRMGAGAYVPATSKVQVPAALTVGNTSIPPVRRQVGAGRHSRSTVGPPPRSRASLSADSGRLARRFGDSSKQRFRPCAARSTKPQPTKRLRGVAISKTPGSRRWRTLENSTQTHRDPKMHWYVHPTVGFCCLRHARLRGLHSRGGTPGRDQPDYRGK